MNLKEKLKIKLIEIPANYKALREIHRLAKDLDVDWKKLKFYLDELSNKNILEEKIEYICPNCGSTEILNKELLLELIEESDEEDCIDCEECCNTYDYKNNKTGNIFYDVKDYSALKAW